MQELTYREIDDGTYSVIGYEGDEEEVVIPEIYLGRPVTVLFDCLFRGHAEIRSVKIPETVTDIGEFAFDGCSSLQSIHLPDSLLNIWQYAFVRSGLTEIAIPGQVRSIMPFTFKDCRQLRKFTCGPDLKKIYAWAFLGCTQLTDCEIPSGTEVSEEAFENSGFKR